MTTEITYLSDHVDDAITSAIDEIRALLHQTPRGNQQSPHAENAGEQPTMPHYAPGVLARVFACYTRAFARILGRTVEPSLTEDAMYVESALSTPPRLDVDTPRQGRLGDCYFVAALCAVADRAPELIVDSAEVVRGIVIVNTPGRRFQLEQTLPVDKSNGQTIYARSPDLSTLVPYLEKAFAVHGGGYPNIGRSEFPGVALEWLTGATAHVMRPADAEGSALAGLMSEGHPTVASSWEITREHPQVDAARQYGLVEGCHAYSVKGIDEHGRVLLHNPWGIRHPRPMPIPTFQVLFSRVEWCEVE